MSTDTVLTHTPRRICHFTHNFLRTSMTPRSRNRFFSFSRPVLVCSLAVLLAACGGDDDDEKVETPPAPPIVNPDPAPTPGPAPVLTPEKISLSLLGRYEAGEFGVSAAEIPAFDAASERGFIVNAQKGAVDVLDLTDPAKPTSIGSLDATDIAAGAQVNSISVQGGIVALAIQAAVKTDPGFVGFYRADTLERLSVIGVGALPDMLTFTPDGKRVLVANEGEPSDDYTVDPEGSISIIDVTNIANPTARIADFRAFNGREAELRDQGVRIFGPGASTAEDLEPEYVAVSEDSSTAWVTLQEANAFARVDIANATVVGVLPLGFKDHSLAANGMDTNDEDKVIDIRARKGVRGIYMPDAMASYTVGGKTYLVTANEGDSRAWGEDNPAYWAGTPNTGFVEEFRVKHLTHTAGFGRRNGDDLPPQLNALATGGRTGAGGAPLFGGALLNPAVFGECGAAAGTPGNCRNDEELGRLNITWTMGYQTDTNGDPIRYTAAGVRDDVNGDRLMYDNLHSYGARSFSIWDEDGKQVWDSANAIETFLASPECMLRAARDLACATYFNSGHDEGNALDSRSDAKGPEAEGIEVAKLGEKTFAFVGLERMGGVLTYDITNPAKPVFADYLNTREDWTTADPGTVLAAAGDLGPEGLKFVPADKSPNGNPLLIVGNEVSGTTAIYTIDQTFGK